MFPSVEKPESKKGPSPLRLVIFQEDLAAARMDRRLAAAPFSPVLIFGFNL